MKYNKNKLVNVFIALIVLIILIMLAIAFGLIASGPQSSTKNKQQVGNEESEVTEVNNASNLVGGISKDMLSTEHHGNPENSTDIHPPYHDDNVAESIRKEQQHQDEIKDKIIENHDVIPIGVRVYTQDGCYWTYDRYLRSSVPRDYFNENKMDVLSSLAYDYLDIPMGEDDDSIFPILHGRKTFRKAFNHVFEQDFTYKYNTDNLTFMDEYSSTTYVFHKAVFVDYYYANEDVTKENQFVFGPIAFYNPDEDVILVDWLAYMFRNHNHESGEFSDWIIWGDPGYSYTDERDYIQDINWPDTQ